MFLKENETYTGPDGKEYPQYTDWVMETCASVAKGDLSTFLRDWLGCLIPIGYQKDIGFEYQYTSERGFEGWELLQNSTTLPPTRAKVSRVITPTITRWFLLCSL